MKKILTIVLLLLVAVFIGLWLFVDLPLSSPTGENPVSRFLSTFPHVKTKKIVYGFLPFWNLDSVVLQPELTHLAYFSLTIDQNGTIVTQLNGNAEPGYHQLQSAEFLELNKIIKAYNGRFDIVFSQLDNETIEAFLNSDSAQATFLQSLDSLLLAYPINGVNLDIEYAGEANADLRGRYTQFVTTVRQHLNKTYQGIQLTVDMYAAAASKPMLWEVDKIAPLTDKIIIMAYDFSQANSLRAGPVAPLLPNGSGWDKSINASLKDFTHLVPPDKLLLGVPFYGYEWQTTSQEAQSFTVPNSGATASYQRVKALLTQKDSLQLTEHWDDNALEPFLTYTKTGKNYTVYYENPQSIGYKLDYVNELGLGGIAIWSLGYDGDSRDLWNTIDQKLEIQN